MPDPFRHVHPREPVHFTARAWNAMLDAAKAEERRQHDRISAAGSELRSGSIVRVKNETGGGLNRYSVLGLDEPIFLPYDSIDAFLREVAFRAVAPSANSQGKFVVLLDPLDADRVGRAYIDGATWVKVDVKSVKHTCADAAAGETDHLVSSTDGTAQILWREKAGQSPSTGVQWALIRFGNACGGSGGSAYCDCPEATYTVEVDCGQCGAYYANGTTMPKYWWLTIEASSSTSYAYTDGCTAVTCEALAGLSIRLANVADAYSAPTCTWEGRGSSCVYVELTIDGDYWKITVMDKDDCVMAIFRMSTGAFNCCGSNSGAGWTAQADNGCDMTISLDPDPCTCCADTSCPPPNQVLCSGVVNCCLPDNNCTITATVNNMATVPCLPFPDCVPPSEDCGSLNGAILQLQWAGDCTWVCTQQLTNARGALYTVNARLTLSGNVWSLNVSGSDGQSANFASDPWNCGTAVTLNWVSGSCPVTTPPPTATFSLL